MLRSALLLSFLLSSEVLAVKYSQGETFEIYSKSCEELRAYAENVTRAFAPAYLAAGAPRLPDCVAEKTRFRTTYKMNLLPLLPKEYFVNGDIVKPVCNGPNCFNTVMYLRGAADYLRYADTMELNSWLFSPICRKIDPSEKRIAGDVTVVRESSKRAKSGSPMGMLMLVADPVWDPLESTCRHASLSIL